ncbi:MAG: MFS transporter [Betaproteobacteria bacterium]
MRRNVMLLAACQALLLINNVIFITLNGLAGYMLATSKGLATLPVTGYVVGGALWAIPASYFMKRYGRRAGFTFGSAMGVAGAGVCALAVSLHSFALLCIGTLITGAYSAFAIQYRFAAADMSTPEFRAKAISLVLAGGIVGGIIGPESAKLTKDLFAVPFVGSYLSLMACGLLSMAVIQFLRIPNPPIASSAGPRRPLSIIIGQPAFIVAVLCSALGYGVMNLLMVATPLAMGHEQHSFDATALVIEWHVIGMFAPGFFTGALIKRFGVLRILFAGIVLNLVCVSVALSGRDVMHFWWALFLLGCGWNFLYVGGTNLLTETYRPEERAKVQGINDACVFATMAVSSFSSGMLLHADGWTMLNRISLVPLAVLLAALIWMARMRRTAAVSLPA